MDIRVRRLNKRGSSQIATIYVILMICFVGAIGLEYYRVSGVLRTLERHMQSTMLTQVTENYQEIYSGAKKKSAAAYTFDEDSQDFNFHFDEGRILADLADDLHLFEEEGKYTNKVNEYTISDLELVVVSAPKEIDSTGRFISTAIIEVEVPFQSVLRILPSYKKKLLIEAKYTRKY